MATRRTRGARHASRTRTGAAIAAASFLVLGATACSFTTGRRTPPPTAASEIETIRDLRLAHNRAIRDRDLDAIARLFEDDIHVTSGIGIHVVGRDAYRDAYEQDFRALDDVVYTRLPDEIQLSSVETGLAERIAAESGTWTGSFVTPRGPAQMRGVYTAMWRKRGGRWRINSEIFVSLTCSGDGCRDE